MKIKNLHKRTAGVRDHGWKDLRNAKEISDALIKALAKRGVGPRMVGRNKR